jgi:hypothetical protein
MIARTGMEDNLKYTQRVKREVLVEIKIRYLRKLFAYHKNTKTKHDDKYHEVKVIEHKGERRFMSRQKEKN